MSYLSSYVFLRRHRSFTSRRLYVCLETILCFLQISDQAYVSRAQSIKANRSGTTWFKCSCLRANLLIVLRVLVQARPWFRSFIWTSSARGRGGGEKCRERGLLVWVVVEGWVFMSGRDLCFRPFFGPHRAGGGGGGGTAIYGLYRYVPLWRVWFSSSLL